MKVSILSVCQGMLLSALLYTASVFALGESALVTIGAYEYASFNPARNETFTIPIRLSDKARLKAIAVELCTHDNDVIRRLPIKNLERDRQDYVLLWDGKDSQQRLVPDEAYYPILVLTTTAGEVLRLDPRDHSGGEEVYDFEKMVNSKAIEYTLPVSSRILIRSGIKNGPMLRTVVDWEPRTSGFHAERWDGRDADGLMAIRQDPQIAYLIIGYQLPDHAIITYGNNQEGYRAYRERKALPIKKANYADRLLERDDRLIRSEFYMPVLQQKSPRITASLLDRSTREPVDHIQGLAEVLTEVKIDPMDEVYLDQERYEITFFVDNQFIAEEEQGFVPFTWRWSPGRFGIKPGDHILTINVSGYNGQIGVKNLPFTLSAEEATE